ncbi:MAG: hypothetical protein NC548_30785 [Lachnospiraceae bacterium]|nr:hypothetical protein [Lachnospiraceae bacterium]
MIFSASLNLPVKKACGQQAMQSNLNKICEQMLLDPDTTTMDVVILGPKDMAPVRAEMVQEAVNNRHPDICVIYLYNKDKEEGLLDCEYKKQCKKINNNAINEAIEEFVGQHEVRQGKHKVSSADFEVPEDDMIGDVQHDNSEEELPEYTRAALDLEENKEPVEEEKPSAFEEEAARLEDFTFDDAPVVEEQPLDTQTEEPDPLNAGDLPPIPQIATFEEQLERMNGFEDWSLFTEKLNLDSVTKQLIQENSEYVGLVNMLDVLDKEIEAVWRDRALSPDQKFEKIKEIGLRRSVVRAATNSINVEKVINIISTIVLSAKRTVDDKIEGLDASLYKITTDKQAIMDTSFIDQAVIERTKVQLDLLNLSRAIVDLYKSIDDLVVAEIAELDKKLPSSNQFINEMVKPLGSNIFTPQNTATLANKLMKALQENRVVASQMEETVNAVIGKLFELCEKDEEIIRYQQNTINLLRAHRVEDVVIVNSLLKNVLRLYTGADNTGRSATAITWCGLLSRRQNSLLIDLTGRSKFREYGIQPISLDEFLLNRIEQQFLCVESDHILAPDELSEMVNQLKSRLNYYPYVNIIMAPEDTVGIDQLSEDAKCIHYITDCSTSSLNVMRDVVTKHTTQNIARKLITIDAPVSPLTIADSVRIDPTNCRIITLPNVPAIRACSIKHDRPYEYNDVAKAFEEAFR